MYSGLATWNFGFCKKIKTPDFNMCFNRSAHSNTNDIPEVDEPKRMLRWTDALNDSSFHTARASREILVHVSENMKV